MFQAGLDRDMSLVDCGLEARDAEWNRQLRVAAPAATSRRADLKVGHLLLTLPYLSLEAALAVAAIGVA